MKHFKNPTFEFHTDGHSKVIAVSSFAGQTVRGVAKCAPNDEFDLEYGQALAAARCAEKIARKRKARATRLLKHAKEQLAMAQKYVDDMTSYFDGASQEVIDTKADTEAILAKM